MTRIRLTQSNFANPWHLAAYVSIDRPNQPGIVDIVHSPQITTVNLNDIVTVSCEPDYKPLFTIDRQDPGLQELMDDLWRIGVRPKDIGTPGHLAATTKHLEDMRAIAFSKLEVQKP